jgi:Fic family protein
MRLNLKKLSQFDLVEEFERSFLADENNRKQFVDFLRIMQEIINADSFIRDCPSFPGSNQTIVERRLSSAVGATLAIEGTMLKEEEVKESFRKADLQQRLKGKEQEAANLRETYKYIINLVRKHEGEFIYSEEHIKKIHYYVTDKIECDSPNVPGQYRDAPASFGQPRKMSFCESRADIEAIMPKFINWLNKEDSGILSSNRIVKAIMAHYYLTEIHPFGDGNGRMARALEALILYANNINTYCFWSLVDFWEANRDEYFMRLGEIRSTCDPWDFLVWGTKGYLDKITETKDLVLKKLKRLMLQDYVRWLFFTKKRIHRRVFGVLMLLISCGKMRFKEFLSSPELMTLYANRAESTRYADFKKMEDKDMLGLIRIYREDGEKFIEPNFEKLEELEYSV